MDVGVCGQRCKKSSSRAKLVLQAEREILRGVHSHCARGSLGPLVKARAFGMMPRCRESECSRGLGVENQKQCGEEKNNA